MQGWSAYLRRSRPPRRAMPETRRLLDRSHQTGFAANTLDRMANQREDAAFIAGLRADEKSRYIVFSGEIPALKPADGTHDALFTVDEAKTVGKPTHKVFLGCHGDRALFGVLIEASAHDNSQDRGDLAFIDLRTIATQGLVTPDIVGALSHAKSLLYWHKHNTFCANCGEATRASVGGSRRECEACGRHHFPRLEPVVIMLVTNGTHCLLGRQEHFPAKMYSCLAGFAEVGETLEDAVRREVMEEAGIKVGRVDYHASQPWPFPSSLMIGCIAEALTGEITLDDHELEDARWVSREEVRLMLGKTHPDGLVCPPKLAIANALMREWVGA